ncbi:MAG: PAS domain S-box protein [Desulfobacteraceae bacterium]|nr:PAS domain S-box protein [Desulfobacteraceae bacterium]
MDEHAAVVEEDLWGIVPNGPVEYLTLASKRDRYTKVTITDSLGEVFISIKGPDMDGVNGLLVAMGFIYQKNMTSDIVHKGQVIGKLTADYHNMNVYVYFYSLLVCILSYIVLVLFYKIVLGKQQLEDRIRERTADLEEEIKERKRASEALLESENRYRLIAENVADVIWTMDMDFKFTFISPSIYHQRGYTVEEAMKHSPEEFVLPESLEKMTALFAQTLTLIESGDKQGFNPIEFEVQQYCKDGSVIWINNNARILHDPDNQPISILGITHDITKRKLVEEELNLSNKRYQNLFQNSPVPLWEEDFTDLFLYLDELRTKNVQDFRKYIDNNPSFLEKCSQKIKILDVNQEVLKLLDAGTKEDLLGNLSKIFTKISYKTFKEEIIAISKGFLEFELEDEIKSLSGDKRSVFFKMTIDKEHSDSYRALIATIDITKRKQLETQLQQAQKMESIGTLAGGIAHDFNNILFPILGHSEMLIEDVPEDSPLINGLNQIYSGAIRASELVKQILTFSRQQSGELKIMKIQPILIEALKLIRSLIPTTIEIKQNINPECGIIKADPTQIHQIVMNLATNGFHAMEETGGVLKVTLKEMEFKEIDLIKPEMLPGVYACLTVADTGKGMNKELTQKIFDPFFTTKETGKGTGMGLSVVHGIVKNMNGIINVYSELGKGTEFNVYLPIAKTEKGRQVTSADASIKGGTEHILLIDDEKAIIVMEQNMLERLGYQVTSRTSSIEALEVFRTNPNKFDMVITDMAMPNISGDILAAQLTKIRPGIPVLLCTGFSETMSEEKAAFIGIKGFLLKPIVMQDLSKKIREVLENNKAKAISQ